jgi:hypothetical protein
LKGRSGLAKGQWPDSWGACFSLLKGPRQDRNNHLFKLPRTGVLGSLAPLLPGVETTLTSPVRFSQSLQVYESESANSFTSIETVVFLDAAVAFSLMIRGRGRNTASLTVFSGMAAFRPPFRTVGANFTGSWSGFALSVFNFIWTLSEDQTRWESHT